MSFSLSTRAVGTVLDRQQIEVSFRMTSNFAAAINAEQDIYLDDGVPGGAVAPPPFLVALEWPLLLRQPYIGLIGANESEYFNFLLHAFHDTRFHRLIKAGDHLEITAVLASVKPTTAGALVTTRLDTCCLRTKLPVATSWIGSLFRGCPVDGEARHAETAPDLGSAQTIPGGETTHIELSRTLPFVYSACSDLWNPIHTQRSFARSAGFPDLVVHGTSTWAIACQRLIDRWGAGRPETLKRYGARFSGLLLAGRAISVHHGGFSECSQVTFSVDDSRGQAVLSRGVAEFVPLSAVDIE